MLCDRTKSFLKSSRGWIVSNKSCIKAISHLSLIYCHLNDDYYYERIENDKAMKKSYYLWRQFLASICWHRKRSYCNLQGSIPVQLRRDVACCSLLYHYFYGKHSVVLLSLIPSCKTSTTRTLPATTTTKYYFLLHVSKHKRKG